MRARQREAIVSTSVFADFTAKCCLTWVASAISSSRLFQRPAQLSVCTECCLAASVHRRLDPLSGRTSIGDSLPHEETSPQSVLLVSRNYRGTRSVNGNCGNSGKLFVRTVTTITTNHDGEQPVPITPSPFSSV